MAKFKTQGTCHIPCLRYKVYLQNGYGMVSGIALGMGISAEKSVCDRCRHGGDSLCDFVTSILCISFMVSSS